MSNTPAVMDKPLPPIPLEKLMMASKHHHNLSIREGTSDDAAFFFEIEEQTTWENLPPDCAQMSREELREKLIETHGLLLSCPGNVFFIAFDLHSGEKFGLLWFGPRHNGITGEHEGWIYNVTTLPAHRGCGVAKKLMEHAENYAGAQGYRVIGLAVATHNDAALSLYRQLDFKQSNILMRKPLAVSTK